MAAEPGFGVYVHWPFCLSKCPYCDFNSHVREAVPEARWRRALLAELDHYAQGTPGRTVTSVFFGGGTPSLMQPETVAAVLERIRALWPTAPDLEVTLEANPGAVEAQRFAGYAAAGVSRLSLGVQALSDEALAMLGRVHDRAEAVAAIELAHASFPRVSFDLIYARPEQTPAAWRAELDEALALAGEHLSVYQLTVEPGTAFHRQRRLGRLRLPDENSQAALYDLTQERLRAAGLPAYEISNHARPGAVCRHNLTYWRYGDYVGVGPGAHGRLTGPARKVATMQHRLPETWLDAVETAGHGTREETPLTFADRREEMVMMSLRLAEGLDRDRFAAETGETLAQAFPAERLNPLLDARFLIADEAGLRATPKGWRRLDAVLGALLA
ncbi:MAG: radical SAM family heme chaperone HemW [Alphaproteobacteria bacterium]|nr:radical SAM family heme chaperone HemW [Alphaproteobacteria bacterium]